MVDEVMKMKEFPNESKNKWTRVFKKKWFLPALYIVLAAFLLSGVVWYQNMQSKLFEGIDDINETDSYQPNQNTEETTPVVQQEETIKMPVQEEAQTEIVTKFYDYDADETEQEKGLTFYNNRYYQSTGVDIAANDGESFEVVASLSGTVKEIKEDPLLGNIVVLEHEDDITTYYASLEEIAVKQGAKVKQGDQLGLAGKNLFSEENGTHVHFEIQKGETKLNPEDFFNKPLTALLEFEASDESSEQVEENEEEELPQADEPEMEEDDNADTPEEDEETNQDLSLSYSA